MTKETLTFIEEKVRRIVQLENLYHEFDIELTNTQIENNELRKKIEDLKKEIGKLVILDKNNIPIKDKVKVTFDIDVDIIEENGMLTIVNEELNISGYGHDIIEATVSFQTIFECTCIDLLKRIQ